MIGSQQIILPFRLMKDIHSGRFSWESLRYSTFLKPFSAIDTKERFLWRKFSAGGAFFHAFEAVFVEFADERKHALVQHAVDDGGFDDGIGNADILHEDGEKMPIDLAADDLLKDGELGGEIHKGKHFLKECGVDALKIGGGEQLPEALVAHVGKEGSEIGDIDALRGKAADRAVKHARL